MTELTLDNPTPALEYVLASHRDAFISFLLNGNTVELSKSRMKRAIDLFLDIRESDGVPRLTAQHEINSKTQSGVQNLTVVQFFCEILTD